MRRGEKMARHSRDFRNATAMRRAEKRRLLWQRLVSLIENTRNVVRASERAVSTLQPAREQTGERRDGVRIVVVAIIDYREIIKRSWLRRVKKSHLTARGQRDTEPRRPCALWKLAKLHLRVEEISWGTNSEIENIRLYIHLKCIHYYTYII